MNAYNSLTDRIIEIICNGETLVNRYIAVVDDKEQDYQFRKRIVDEVILPAYDVLRQSTPVKDMPTSVRVHVTSIICTVSRRIRNEQIPGVSDKDLKTLPLRDVNKAPHSWFNLIDKSWNPKDSDPRSKLSGPKAEFVIIDDPILNEKRHDDIVDAFSVSKFATIIESLDTINRSTHNQPNGDTMNEVEDELLAIIDASDQLKDEVFNALFENDEDMQVMELETVLTEARNRYASTACCNKPFSTLSMRQEIARVYGIELTDSPQPTHKPTEQNPMKFETIQYINGTNVSHLNKESLITLISDAEARIKKLEEIETESETIGKEIGRIQAFIGSVVKVLDSVKD